MENDKDNFKDIEDTTNQSDNKENSGNDSEDSGYSYEEFMDMVYDILPGEYLGETEMTGGATSSVVYASAETNENGDYDIYIAYDTYEVCSSEPEYEFSETVKRENIKEWLENHRLDKDLLDDGPFGIKDEDDIFNDTDKNEDNPNEQEKNRNNK